jgi:hypothetical protein
MRQALPKAVSLEGLPGKIVTEILSYFARTSFVFISPPCLALLSIL